MFGGEFGELLVEAFDAAMGLFGSGAEIVHGVVWFGVIGVDEFAVV